MPEITGQIVAFFLFDVAETIALVSLPPLLIMATGVFDAIRS